MTAERLAREDRPFEALVGELDGRMRWAKVLIGRLERVVGLPRDARILDIGAAGGEFVLACRHLGYDCEGVEPWKTARLNAARLSAHAGITIRMVEGTAENLPYAPATFDVVTASSVMEHVLDVDKAFAEASRVLKPGGVFWFATASSVSPRQHEIRGFPFFGWYPDLLKLRIMRWVKDARPHLVGHTRTPAIHWFTPSKARTLLRRHGFTGRIYDRWDLRGEGEGGTAYRVVLRAIRLNAASKTVADVLVPGCAYAAVK
jgi:2-polyprenyl-6-hydroxyphenyl methylase/3-demethylubiquinone-9 3-methyltransferase